MSVQNQTVKNVYAGNGSTTVFPFTFALLESDGEYVSVYVTNDAGISEETDNFTINATAKTVTYPKNGDPLPAGKKIVIRREIPNEQELNLENLGPFFADDVEGEFDREVMMIQQLQEAVNRSIKVDPASETTPAELIAELLEASADAVSAASAAAISETNAGNSATAAHNSEVAAASSETAAGNSATAAGNSATAAGNSATAAYNSQVAAASSETNAGNSATAANNSKIAAAASETNAGNSATAAGNSATAAGNSATAAHNSQVAAKASEDAAAQSAAEAAGINYLVRKNSTYYEAGVVAFYQTIPSPLVLECTTAGTTASAAPDFSGAAEGDTITDGAVVWTYRNILSGGGVAVGFIMPYAGTGLQEGWLDCDGSAVSRTMYPDLFAAIGTTWGAGDGSTTFNLPRSEDLVLQGASATNPVGTYKQAGLPNIEGQHSMSAVVASAYENAVCTGPYKTVSTGSSRAYHIDFSAGASTSADIGFDASQSNSIYGASNTVQPPAACVRYMIKAFDGQTPDSALIDITQYAADLANKADRSLSNLNATGEAKIADIPLDENFTIIYPNGGTEANPATVARNTRYVEPNPFPGYSVMCICEIYLDNNWGDPCFAYYNGGYGIAAHQLNDDLIVVQAGNSYTVTKSTYTGSPLGFTGEALATPQICRAKVWKIGKAANNA